MLICHKRVASNEAAVLQACHMSDVHAPLAVSIMPASCVSNTITRQRCITTTAVARRSCRTHKNCMHAEQLIIIFYIFYFKFCSMYLVLFSIVLYRTIVTVYTNNIFLYNYPQQMHQIINLSPVACFPASRGKSVQKIREVSGVKGKCCTNWTIVKIFLFKT